MESVGAWHTGVVLRRRPMRLRTKVTLFFGLIALVATVTLTIVTYAFAASHCSTSGRRLPASRRS